MEIKAYAKINLSLDVVRRRDDGFHDMLMVMQAVTLHDAVSVTVRPGAGVITAETDRRYVPNGPKNIAYKAAAAFLAAVGERGTDVSVSITKHIPVCAGLGGGSADAAAVIRGLNGLLGTGLAAERLMEIGAAVGSDVPFCLMGGTALATGRGEKLEKLPDLPDCRIVCVKPGFSDSTPRLFARLDRQRIKMRPDTAGMTGAVRRGSLKDAAYRCFNVFEGALPSGAAAEVDSIKDRLVSGGALGAAMTGTGSAVFGIFADEASAAGAAALLAEYRERFVTAPAGGRLLM